ncbi:IS21 family transposase [Macrococcus brunensis]|uniref:IS21 family transposase n=1 Tax=Macrococcus brunensis TaxID=198483 RepID=UPI001EF0D6B5|nr:IS21 family transposase [Macrococcus brunensis]ULG70896.1 IS21 family transposase [Macrococcus brunensis]ULG71972.1 IS21 family transposase [Macrococcus brunensis]
MRKDIREGVKNLMNEEAKPSYAALARKFNCDYRTIKQVFRELQTEESNQTKSRRKSKLDPYKEIIKTKLEAECTAYSIYLFIRRKGYDGSYSLVKQYCRKEKVERTKKATIRVEHTPGLSAQVDWKEDMVLHTCEGKVVRFNIFLYVLSYSKKKYITLTFDRSQDTLFYCLDDAFIHTGGVPKEIWFDNMRTVVDQSRTRFSQVKFNQRFYEFSKDAGFKPIACRPYRPQTKGIVESLARTMDRLKVYDYEISDTVELINIIDDFCIELNQEFSQAISCPPEAKWMENEKKYLHELPPNLLNPYFEEQLSRVVSKEAMVQFRKCKYSVDPRYIGKEVDIEISEDGSIQIYHNNELIRTHTLTIDYLNYHEEDKFNLLKSDLYRHKSDEEIRMIMNKALSDYDRIERRE